MARSRRRRSRWCAWALARAAPCATRPDPTNEFGQLILDAIAFAAGAALCAMLGLMQLRVDRAGDRASGYLLLWVLGFIWTFGNFLRCALALAGASPDSVSARFAETFAWSCTLLGPVAM